MLVTIIIRIFSPFASMKYQSPRVCRGLSSWIVSRIPTGKQGDSVKWEVTTGPCAAQVSRGSRDGKPMPEAWRDEKRGPSGILS